MKRSEFIEEIDSWSSLLQFCYDEDLCDFYEDIYEWNSLEDWVEENLEELVRNNSWRRVLDYLVDINGFRNYGFFRMNGWFEFEELDDYADLERYKDDVIDYMDENGLWDEDIELELEIDTLDFEVLEGTEKELDDETVEEDFSLNELMISSKEELQKNTNKDEIVEECEDHEPEIDIYNFVYGLSTTT